MKKVILIIATILFLCSTVVAHSSNIKAIEINSKGNNLKASDNKLCEVVQEELESNLSKYTNLNVLNSTDKKAVIEGNKKGEGELDIGKFKIASHSLFMDITRVNSSYTITLRLTDLTTRENLVTLTSNATKDTTELYSGNGSVIDKLFLELCHRLNITVSELDKKIIMEGEETLTDREKEALYNTDIKLYNKKIDELNKELKRLKDETSLEAKLNKNALSLEIAENEQRLILAQKSKERLIERNKKKEEDEEKNQNRSLSQQKKITNMSENINEKLEELRNKKIEDASLFQILKLTELKKLSYIENRNELNKDLKVMESEIKEERERVIKEIEERPFKTAELTSKDPKTGKTLSEKVPTTQALKNREKEKEFALKKIEDNDVKAMENYKSEAEKEIALIEKDISNDYKSIKPRLITSLNDEIVVTYEKYDSVKYGWPLKVSVQIDDSIILETTSFLPYNKLTGKKAIKELDIEKSEEYQDFMDTVDLYESLFSTGKEILTFSMNYMVKPMKKDYPSKYEVSFNNFLCYDTKDVVLEDNKIISKAKCKLKLDEDKIYKQLLPIHDMRTDEEIKAYNEKHKNDKVKEENGFSSKSVKEENESNTSFSSILDSSKEKVNDAISYHNTNENTSLASLKVVVNNGGVNGSGFELSYNYYFSKHFHVGATTRFIFSQDSQYYGLYYANHGTIWDTLLQVGYRYKLDSLFKDVKEGIVSFPTVYVVTGIGFGLNFPQYYGVSGNFFSSTEVGLETTINNCVTISSGMGMDWGAGKQKVTNATGFTSFNWNLGVGYSF